MKSGFFGENFTDEADIAASVAPTRGIKVGGALGNVYAQAVAGTGGCSIAAGKKVTLVGSESDALDGTYADNGVVSTRTFANAEVFVEGDVIAELPFLSYSKAYGKVAFSCDDAAAEGKIKIIAMPRG